MKKNLTSTRNTTKAVSKKTRTQISVENAIAILENAINGGISLSESSRASNFNRSYLTDVKSRITNNYENKKITRDTYRNFNKLLREYNKLNG